MTRPSLLGAVLAGGKSRRYGRDKSLDLIAGKPLAVRAAETLAEVFSSVVVVSSSKRVVTDWPHVPDLREGYGPLAGVEAALQYAADEALDGVFVLACDLPLVDASIVRSVTLALGEQKVVAPQRKAFPGVEPLCAAYHISCLETVVDALERGELAVHQIFETLRGRVVRLPEESFLNVNTPADREVAIAALRREADQHGLP